MLVSRKTSTKLVAGSGTTIMPDITSVATLLSGIPVLGGPETAGTTAPDIEAQLQRSSEHEADICIIGSGPAGYVAAIRAAQLGARVVIVEKGDVGGVCLNVGCIPTKVLLSCVGVLEHCRNAADFGVDLPGYTINIPSMMSRKDQIVKQLVNGVQSLFRKNRIRLERGNGWISGLHEVTVSTTEGERTISTDKIVIATGSEPARLPIQGLEFGGDVWSSTEALSFDKVPEKMVIIGAGAIGLEAGYTFARLGAEVSIVEMMGQVLPSADTEIANTLQKALERAGIRFLLNSGVTAAQDTDRGKRVFVKTTDGEVSLEADKVLVAIGRRAVLDGVNLESVDVKHDGRRITVNESMQTNIPNIYAIGDVIGEPMLAHVGWTEGIVAVEHALGLGARMSYKAYPGCVYTSPECASVGLTEHHAREMHSDIRVGKFTFNHNGKAMGIGEADGFVKVISEPRYGEILGVHIIGPHATDLISEAVLAVANELTVDELMSAIHPHPTLSEVVQEAAYDTRGRSIHK